MEHESASDLNVHDQDMNWEPSEKLSPRSSVHGFVPSYEFSVYGGSPCSPQPDFDPHDVDMISCLPGEIAFKVFGYLDAKDLARAAQTCHVWNNLANDDVLWKQLNQAIGLPDQRSVLADYVRRSGFNYSLWKLNYIRLYMIDRNWRFATRLPYKRIPAHRNHLITCLVLTNDNRVICGSDDSTLTVWSIDTGLRCLTLEGHNGGVWTAEVEGQLLVSGATDKSLRVWNLINGSSEGLFGHTGTVRCLAIKDGICVSGSRDCTLRVWRVVLPGCHLSWNGIRRSGCQGIGVLTGHTDSVRCVRYSGDYIVSGSYDHQIRVWNPSNCTCLHVLVGHTARVYSLQFDGFHIVSGSLDTTIRVWDVKTGMLMHVLHGHESLISGLQQRDNILVSGNADTTVRMWDIKTGTCLKTLGLEGDKHYSAVTSVHFDHNFVVTSSDDGTCKLWDLHTGKFIRDIVRLDSRSLGGTVWRIAANQTKLICAIGSRDHLNPHINHVEQTQILIFDFDVQLSRIVPRRSK